MKKLLISILFLPVAAIAQKKYQNHTVAPKESLYSIAREYNIAPKELAAINNLDINSGLKIGQVIKVPATNATAPMAEKPQPAASSTTSSGPVYHTVQKGETLYGISQKYGKVPVEDLKAWNNIDASGIKVGQQLIVKNGSSAPAPEAKSNAAADDLAAQKAELARKQKELEEQERRIKAEEEKRAEDLARREAEDRKRQEAELAKARKEQDQKTIDDIQEKRTTPATPAVAPKSATNGGFFSTQYDGAKGIEQTGLAGTFKSTSGWEDTKYYCLHNDAPIGSIIKITNPANGSYVYAKVLDVIPDLKLNVNIIVRLSNAAASQLRQGEENFNCVVNY